MEILEAFDATRLVARRSGARRLRSHDGRALGACPRGRRWRAAGACAMRSREDRGVGGALARQRPRGRLPREAGCDGLSGLGAHHQTRGRRGHAPLARRARAAHPAMDSGAGAVWMQWDYGDGPEVARRGTVLFCAGLPWGEVDSNVICGNSSMIATALLAAYARHWGRLAARSRVAEEVPQRRCASRCSSSVVIDATVTVPPVPERAGSSPTARVPSESVNLPRTLAIRRRHIGRAPPRRPSPPRPRTRSAPRSQAARRADPLALRRDVDEVDAEENPLVAHAVQEACGSGPARRRLGRGGAVAGLVGVR